MFLVDQPGIGGLKTTEAGYLAKYGPGHFDFTFLLAEKGFNELEMKLLQHLIHNKKRVAFVRTKCDSTVRGTLQEYKVCILEASRA